MSARSTPLSSAASSTQGATAPVQRAAALPAAKAAGNAAGAAAAAPQPAPQPAVVPLSQVTDLQAAMASAGSSAAPHMPPAALPPGGSRGGYAGVDGTFRASGSTPGSQANSVLMMMSDAAEQYMCIGSMGALAGGGGGAEGLLGPPDSVLPRHPPGDVTPSSVTSSCRAGLHWNIPGTGSVPPSPGKGGAGGGSNPR
jgi:hypothetical protein